MEKLKTVTISRKKWWRGNRAAHESGLRMEDGMQCCLGFVCRAYGLKAADILNVGMPSCLSDKIGCLPSWLTAHSETADVTMAAKINDSQTLDDRTRESKIREIFRRHGIRTVFTP